MHLIPLITCRVKNSLADNQDSLDDCLTALWILSSFGLLYPMEMLSFHYGRKKAHISQDWASAALLNESSVSMRGHAPQHMSQRTRPHTGDTPTRGTWAHRRHAPTERTRPHREHMSQRTCHQAKDMPTPGAHPHRGHAPTQRTRPHRAHVPGTRPHQGHTQTGGTPTQRTHPPRGHAHTESTCPRRHAHTRDTPTPGHAPTQRTHPHRKHMSQRSRPQARDTPTPGTRPHPEDTHSNLSPGGKSLPLGVSSTSSRKQKWNIKVIFPHPENVWGLIYTL